MQGKLRSSNYSWEAAERDIKAISKIPDDHGYISRYDAMVAAKIQKSIKLKEWEIGYGTDNRKRSTPYGMGKV